MKTSWSPIIVDGFILLVVSTVFVFLLDFGFKALTSSSADVSNPLVSNILQSAVLGSKNKEVSDLIKETAKKNPNRINLPDEHGDTPLMRTCYVNFDDYTSTMEMDVIRLPYVTWLIEVGADVNATDKDGWNALCWASWSGITQVADKLIQQGSRIHTTDKEGNTPLSIAALRGNADIVRILLIHGADKNTVAKNGFKPIDFAKQEFERYNASFSPDEELDRLDPNSPKGQEYKSYFNSRNRIQRLQEVIRLLSK